MQKTPKKRRRTKVLGPQKEPNPAMTHGLTVKIDINKIDGRTRLGKAITIIKDQLREYVSKPTPLSELLIQRITYKSVKLGLYEAYSLTELSNDEAAHYLPMTNSLRSDLQVLASLAGKSESDLYRTWRERFLKQGDNRT